MRPRPVVVGAFLVILLVGVTGVFVVGLLSELGDGAESGSSPAETPVFGDVSGGESPSTPAQTGTRTPGETPPPPFAFSIDSVEPCGWTCRDVTSTMTNQQETAATDVTVFARISIGRDDGDVVWEGTETVGTLEAGEAYTVTRRVRLSYGEGFAVRQAGGWVTVQTTVRTADRTVTFTEQRQVA